MKSYYKKSYEVEYDVNMISEKIARDYDLPNDFYGDCYPDEVCDYMLKMNLSDNVDDYTYYLDMIKRILETCADYYVAWFHWESEEQ